MNATRLGIIIKAKRQSAGLGLRSVAAQIGISASTLSRLERGIGAAPDAETMIKLAKWLEASVDDLLFWGGTKFEKSEELSTLDQIAVCLRTDKKLSPDAAEALIQLFRVAYLQVVNT